MFSDIKINSYLEVVVAVNRERTGLKISHLWQFLLNPTDKKAIRIIIQEITIRYNRMTKLLFRCLTRNTCYRSAPLCNLYILIHPCWLLLLGHLCCHSLPTS